MRFSKSFWNVPSALLATAAWVVERAYARYGYRDGGHGEQGDVSVYAFSADFRIDGRAVRIARVGGSPGGSDRRGGGDAPEV